MNRVRREAIVESIMDANVLIPPSQPDRHDDPPLDTPQDTDLEDTNWAHGLFIPAVTEHEAMCFANIGTDTACSPFDLDEIHDPGIFPEQSNRTRQSDPAMNPEHKKARRLAPVSSALWVSVRAPGLLDLEQLIALMHLPALPGSTKYNNTTLNDLPLLVKASCTDGFRMTRVYLGGDCPDPGVMFRPNTTPVTTKRKFALVLKSVRPRLRQIIADNVESFKLEQSLKQIEPKTIKDYEFKYETMIARRAGIAGIARQ